MKRIFILAWLLVVLGVINYIVVSKETLRGSGRRVLLRLAPVDPRSLMQGDYMDLRYELAGQIPGEDRKDGFAILRIGADDVGTFLRVEAAPAPAAGECIVKYRRRARRTQVGAESYFFQEGRAHLYAGARFGDLRVSQSGDVLLVGLADENGRPIIADR